MIIFICRPRRSVWVICCSNIKITYIYERKQKSCVQLEGKVVAREIKVGIVAARFNEFNCIKISGRCQRRLLRHDVKDEDIDLAWVPGAFEIPLIASKMAKKRKI